MSAEHGIGLDKKAYLGFTRTEEEIAPMRAVKRAVDPTNILNPGNICERGLRRDSLLSQSALTSSGTAVNRSATRP